MADLSDILGVLTQINSNLSILAGYVAELHLERSGEKVYEVASWVLSQSSRGDGCVYLYGTHPGLKYRVATVYEDHWDKLPFDPAAATGARLWDGEVAPSREAAAQKRYINACEPFQAVLKPTGGTTEAGHPMFRFVRALPAAAKPAPQPAPAVQPPASASLPAAPAPQPPAPAPKPPASVPTPREEQPPAPTAAPWDGHRVFYDPLGFDEEFDQLPSPKGPGQRAASQERQPAPAAHAQGAPAAGGAPPAPTARPPEPVPAVRPYGQDGEPGGGQNGQRVAPASQKDFWERAKKLQLVKEPQVMEIARLAATQTHDWAGAMYKLERIARGESA